LKRGPGRSAWLTRACDRLLDVGVVALGVWTLAYHACLLLRLGVPWAVAGAALAVVPACWLTLGRAQDVPEAVPDPGRPLRVRRNRRVALLAVNLAAAVVAAVGFATRGLPWIVVWLLWLVAAASALAFVVLRPRGNAQASADVTTPRWELVVVAAWAVGLAVLASLIVNPNSDDAYYMHFAAWIGAHGEFPLRDVLYSDQRFPALYYPPLNSYEALVGSVTRLTSVPAPTVSYLWVTPAATVAAVLAVWRLLREWRAPVPALALSVSLAFLLYDLEGQRNYGGFFVGRLWQGKAVFVCALVPVLFTLLHQYAERPSGRRLALLAWAGVAAIGLSTTAIFVVPVLAAGSLAPVALRRLGTAAAGLAAVAGYPIAMGAVTLATGGRTPDVYTTADVIPRKLAHFVLARDVPALIALIAILCGPMLIRRRLPAQMVAAPVLLVGCLLAPTVPLLIFDLTGLGRVLWRLLWAIPAAALVGLVATGAVEGRRANWARVPLAAAIVVAMVLGGQSLWTAPSTSTVAGEFTTRPEWKLPPTGLSRAKAVLSVAEPGDVILAPAQLSWIVTAVSGDVTVVDPRHFYTRSLADIPAARLRDRILITRFLNRGAQEIPGATRVARIAELRRGLRSVGVDIVCLLRGGAADPRLVVEAGYPELLVERGAMMCLGPRGSARRLRRITQAPSSTARQPPMMASSAPPP
jgi:hypothetical protein